jgi:hypothetical protein
MRLTRRAGLALFAAVGVIACRADSPLSVPAAPSADGTVDAVVQSLSLLQCTPLAADSATQTIGPWGGVLQVGPHLLIVPAGALATPVTITAVMPSDSVNRIEFQPEGLTFAQPAYLRLSYANCSGLGAWLPKQVVYTNDALEILESVLSFDNPWTKSVTGQIRHFSNYAIAW